MRSFIEGDRVCRPDVIAGAALVRRRRWPRKVDPGFGTGKADRHGLRHGGAGASGGRRPQPKNEAGLPGLGALYGPPKGRAAILLSNKPTAIEGLKRPHTRRLEYANTGSHGWRWWGDEMPFVRRISSAYFAGVAVRRRAWRRGSNLDGNTQHDSRDRSEWSPRSPPVELSDG